MDVIDRAFAKLHGLACWGVHWAPAAGLSFSFGEPSARIRQPMVSGPSLLPRVQRTLSYRAVVVKGAWWFWSWCGLWELRLADDERPISARSATRRRAEGLRFLDGQRLLSVGVDPRDGCTELLFDLGAALRLWGDPYDPGRLDDDIWALHTPRGRVLLVRSDGCFSYDSGRSERRWRPRR